MTAITEYKILKGIAAVLEKEVQAYIEKGWAPLGGPVDTGVVKMRANVPVFVPEGNILAQAITRTCQAASEAEGVRVFHLGKDCYAVEDKSVRCPHLSFCGDRLRCVHAQECKFVHLDSEGRLW